MNLIGADLKASITSAMKDIYDSFARSVTFYVYKMPEETVVSLDAEYNGDWGVGNSDVTVEEVKQSFRVRMWYLDYEQQFKSFFIPGKEMEGARFIRELGQIKIQLEQDAYDFIRGATRVVIFDENYIISSDVKKIGTVDDFVYYTFILKKQP